MARPYPPFGPNGDLGNGDPRGIAGEAARRRRLRDIPLRGIFPSLITLLAIGAGLTAIRFAVENRIGLAIGAIILAAFLDAIDGRVARFLKSTSRFGAELDSLADFVNFGVAPALLIYFTLLDSLNSFGWIAALIYAICVCLRLARFNVMLDQAERPKWQSYFFTGIPAPAGALTVLVPVYAFLLGLADSVALDLATAFYTVCVGLMMVSRVPTWSGKDIGKRIPRAQVAPVLILVVGFVAILLSYPWQTMLAGVAIYLAAIPFAWRDWQRHVVAEAADSRRAEAAPPVALPPSQTKSPDQRG